MGTEQQAAGQNRAVVLGGGVAGLMAAHVLARHFDQVTLVERDAYPEGIGLRRGVPQGHHVHRILLAGREVMDAQLPGVIDELTAHGAPLVDPEADNKLLLPTGEWSSGPEVGVRMMLVSRELLDWVMRSRVLAEERIAVVEGTSVTGLATSDGRVTGVRVAEGDHDTRDGSGGTTIEADLVVDATGRGSSAPRWLEEAGFEAPAETKVNAGWGYASRFYRAPAPDGTRHNMAIMPGLSGPVTRGGIIGEQDGERLIVTLLGCAKDYPPREEDEFNEYARSLAAPDLFEAMQNLEPVSDVHIARTTVNRWRHYESVERRPEGFVLIGDSVCAFNPIHGQGVSVAVMGADLLDQQLRESGIGSDGFAARFQTQLVGKIEDAWLLSTEFDYRIPGVEGAEQPEEAREFADYLDRFRPTMGTNPDARRAMEEVINLVRNPMSLKSPEFLVPAGDPSDVGSHEGAH